MPGEVSTLKAALLAVANFFGFLKGRQEHANTPEMKAAAKGETDQKLKDSAATAVAKQDIDEVRRRVSG